MTKTNVTEILGIEKSWACSDLSLQAKGLLLEMLAGNYDNVTDALVQEIACWLYPDAHASASARNNLNLKGQGYKTKQESLIDNSLLGLTDNYLEDNTFTFLFVPLKNLKLFKTIKKNIVTKEEEVLFNNNNNNQELSLNINNNNIAHTREDGNTSASARAMTRPRNERQGFQRRMVETFTKLTGIVEPTNYQANQKTWYQPLWAIYCQAIGSKAQTDFSDDAFAKFSRTIKAAVDKCKQSQMAIKSPSSIVWAVNDAAGEKAKIIN